jgi:hypothetical protein
VDDLLERWRDPVFNDPHRNVPASLAARLIAMAGELTAGENVAEAIANARIPGSPDDLPVMPLRHGALPRRLRVYYERMYALFAVAACARSTKPATFRPGDPPSDAEKRFGSVIGQAFHQGCSLPDVALAADIPEDQIVAIGKRTIKRTGWLDRL